MEVNTLPAFTDMSTGEKQEAVQVALFELLPPADKHKKDWEI